jgi:beta-lactamase regulating signal transducer with metallopeptidase domain
VTAVAELLLSNTVTAAVLAIVVLALCRFARLSPAARHALWLVVDVRLLSPVGLLWSVPLPVAVPPLLCTHTHPEKSAPGPSGNPPEAAGPGAAPVHEEPVPVAVWAGDPGERLPAGASAEATDPGRLKGAAPESSPAGSLDWRFGISADEGLGQALAGWLQLLWLGGAVLVTARSFRRTARFFRYARTGKPAPPALRRQVAELAAVLGVRAPPVRVLAGLLSPVVWCLFRPVLLWPQGLQDRLRGGGRRAVLVHELAHLRRRDHWVRWLELTAAALHWWNPLFWFVRRQLRFHAELACDAWVTGTLPETRRDYAEALLEVCARSGRAAAPSPAVGVGGDGRRDFRRRLTMIMSDRVPCRLAAGPKLCVALLLLAALPAWTLGQGQPEPKRDAKAIELRAADPQGRAIVLWEVQDTRGGADTQAARKVKEIEARIAELQKQLQDLKAARAAAGGQKKTQPLHLEVHTAPRAGWRLAEPLHVEVKLPDAAAKQPQYKVIGPDGKEIKGAKVIVAQPNPGPARVEIREWQVAPAKGVEPKPSVPHSERLTVWLKDRADQAITLSRATYALPRDKAQALAAFLKENVKAPVLELKEEGQGLTVTATPETQAAVGAIVRLMAPGQVRGRAVYPLQDLRIEVPGRIEVPEGKKK